MAVKTVILITGANRGIGKALLQRLLSRPDHVLIAGVRDPSSPASKSLLELPRGKNSSVLLTKIDSASDTDPFTAIETIVSKHGIKHLDLAIANAGISDYFGKAEVTPAEEMTKHFRVNTIGPLLLFRATADLLKAAPCPKFIAISSGAGSIGGMEKLKDVHNTAYGSSKAALNFVMKRIHLENPELIAFPINPGWLQTDLGNHAASLSGSHMAPVTVEEGVAGVLAQIDGATRETTSGRFYNYDGSMLEW